MVPTKYGIVKWQDAAGMKTNKIRPDRATKNLATRESVGWLFFDAEGTVVVVHDYHVERAGTLRRAAEYTLIPKVWVQSIIELVEKDNGSRPDAVPISPVPESGRSEPAHT